MKNTNIKRALATGLLTWVFLTATMMWRDELYIWSKASPLVGAGFVAALAAFLLFLLFWLIGATCDAEGRLARRWYGSEAAAPRRHPAVVFALYVLLAVVGALGFILLGYALHADLAHAGGLAAVMLCSGLAGLCGHSLARWLWKRPATE